MSASMLPWLYITNIGLGSQMNRGRMRYDAYWLAMRSTVFEIDIVWHQPYKRSVVFGIDVVRKADIL